MYTLYVQSLYVVYTFASLLVDITEDDRGEVDSFVRRRLGKFIMSLVNKMIKNSACHRPHAGTVSS